MPPQRLPIVNNDDGVWGDIIRQYLMKEHYNDDTNNAANGGHHKVTIRAGTASAGTAPLKFTSGTLLSSPEAGAVEFNSDTLYFTQTTSTIRKKIATYNDASGATGDIYYRDSGGSFTRLGAGSTGDILTIASGIPSWTASIVGKVLDNTNTVTLKDANFTLQDDGDATKQARFQLSGITAGNVRTFTLPDASSTLINDASDQNISGVKSFESMTYAKEVWITPTNGPGNTAALTLDNDNGQIWQNTNNSGGSWALWDQTHSKAPILVQPNSHDQMIVVNPNGVYVDDSYFTVVNLADPTKQARFQLSGITSGQLRSLTLPDASTTLVGHDVPQTLTNKTLVLPGVASPTYTQGKLVYDTDSEALTFYNGDSNVSLQVGQEEWIRVVNNTGSTIANGAAVYISGASSGLPTVALARANAAATTVCAGLATESIPNNSIGYVTCIGLVRNVNTASFTAGQTVYLSSAAAGALVSTVPAAPNYRYRVGIVGVSHASTGTIHVTPSTAALGTGTANQLLGTNAAGTAQEMKDIVGATNDVTVTHSSNTITLALGSNAVTATSATNLSNKTLTAPVLSGTVTGTYTLGGTPTFPSSVVTTTGTQTLTAKTLTNPTVNNYTEGTVVIGTVTTAATIDITNGTVQTATLTASTACTFTMPTAGAGKSFVLFLKQAASTGLGTATFTGVKWPGGTAPTITAAAGQMDILTFTSDGTNWYGTFIQGFTP